MEADVQKSLEEYNGKTVLITGGAGAIGYNLVRVLLPITQKVVVIDDLSSGHKENLPSADNIEFIEGDILNPEALDKAFSHNPDIVFHLAANFANQNSIDHPVRDLEVNIRGTLQCLQKSQDTGVKRFVYTSSSCVYGNQSGLLSEDSTSDDLDTPYAVSKLGAEYYVKLFAKLYNMDTVILRMFNCYGEGEEPGKYRNVIPNFFLLAMNREPLTVFGEGTDTRSYTYAQDTVLATALSGVKKAAVGETINIGINQETPILELAKAINSIAGNDGNITHQPRRSWDHITSRMCDNRKCEELLGFVPETDLEVGLKNTYEWLKTRIQKE